MIPSGAFSSCRTLARTWLRLGSSRYSSMLCRHFSTSPTDPDDEIPPASDIDQPPIPPYKPRVGEPVRDMRARLVYQSRKRGMLENGLLLSTFAAKYLDKMSHKQLEMYDSLINEPTNDWDIYYWVTGRKPTPVEYDTEVMDMLKEHTLNRNKEQRIRQPDLY